MKTSDPAHSRAPTACTGTRDPLTTPIYETTTFVFENAQEVRDYNEGRSTKFLYSRYGNPTVAGGRGEVATARRRRSGDAAFERPGGDDHRAARRC